MQAIVKDFVIPVSLCVLCAVGGWSLGRESTGNHASPNVVGNASTRSHAQASGDLARKLDATSAQIVRTPRLLRCDGLHRVATIRREAA